MTEKTVLLALVVALLLGLVTCVVLLLRRRAPAPDPGLLLVQQQMTRLAEQLSEVSAAVPREMASAMGTLVGQVGARLAENAQAVQRVGADTGRLIADVGHRLGELGKSSQQILELGQDIRGLQQIFQAPKTRGALGEISLGALLEQSFPREHFVLQSEFQSGDRVDALLRLPGGAVPIDSKFPLAGFRSRLEASTDEQRARAARAFARDVRKHVDDIADKYIRPSEGTLDFALMYVPAESVFYEIIVRGEEPAGEEDLNAYALKRRVVPVSPNSLYAYLQAIAFGLMGLKVERRARDILRGLQQLQGDLGQFQDTFDLGRKHLRNAEAAFSDAGDRFGRLATEVGQFARAVDETPGPEEARPPRLVSRQE